MVLDASDNQLAGTLSDFAFQAAANRADLHSALRYFDVGNNSLAGKPPVTFGIIMDELRCPASTRSIWGAHVPALHRYHPAHMVVKGGFRSPLQKCCESMAPLYMD